MTKYFVNKKEVSKEDYDHAEMAKISTVMGEEYPPAVADYNQALWRLGEFNLHPKLEETINLIRKLDRAALNIKKLLSKEKDEARWEELSKKLQKVQDLSRTKKYYLGGTDFSSREELEEKVRLLHPVQQYYLLAKSNRLHLEEKN